MAKKCPKCHHENPDTLSFCGDCGSKLSIPKDIPTQTKTLETPFPQFTPGTSLAGRYEVIEELGKGGMGKVYKAIDTQINEEVAIKLIRPEIVSDERTLERFGNELKLARKIAHKNVCKMFHLEREEETPYITMEYVKGEDLKTLITKKGKLREEEAISIAKQVCEGLAEAHELGIIHRDLKPSNIMIDEKGHLKIMDFGIARSLEAPGVTKSGVIIGTPDYISPEQVEGEGSDQRSDIYSLGIILYEMVTGSVPFTGDSALSVVLKHKSQLPKDPKKLNLEISEKLSRLILICLEKNRERRYQNAEELLTDLKNIEEGFPLGAEIRPRRETFIELLIRKKLFIPTFALIALIIVAIIIMQFLSKKETFQLDPNKPSVAILYFKNNTGDEGLDHWRDALATWLITDLSQSKYLNVLPQDKLYGTLRKLELHEAKLYATEDFQNIANESRVSHILRASYSKVENTFRIDYTLKSAATMVDLSSDYVSGEGEASFMGMLDEITRKVKGDLKLSAQEISTDIDKDLAEITTSSETAFKSYAQGLKYVNAGERDKSLPFFEEAVRIDPDFAMAYKELALVNQTKDYTKYREYLKKAMDLVDKVSERERYLITGSYYSNVDIDHIKAIDAYTQLLEIYPDDIEGNSELGGIYFFRFGEYEKDLFYSERAYRRLKNYMNCQAYAQALSSTGQRERAREVVEDFLDNVEDNPRIRALLVSSHIGSGEFDLAFEENERVIQINPLLDRTHVILYAKKDFAALEKHYLEKAAKYEGKPPFNMRRFLANTYFAMGQFQKAIELLTQGIRQAEEDGPKVWIVRLNVDLVPVLIEMGMMKEALEALNSALKVIEELKINTDLINPAKVSVYSALGEFDKAVVAAEEHERQYIAEGRIIEERGLIKNKKYTQTEFGKIELAKGNYEEAVRLLEEAMSWSPNILVKRLHRHLALAYYSAGMLEKALDAYTQIAESRRWDYDLIGYITAKSYYMMGKISEELKNKSAAIEHYEKFLTLWKDADPGIAEVDDARKRLAGLRSR
jgi:serine/threonine-protein kinase